MGKCSFAKLVLNDVFKPLYPFGKDLEGRFLYIEDGKNRWLLGAFDFAGTFRRTALAWRTAVSSYTGIPIGNIWYHELQIHAAPTSYELEGEPCNKLIEKTIPVIADMISHAEEASLCCIISDFKDRFTLNREQYIPELGAVTVWAGLQFDKNGHPFTQDPAIMNLDDYKPKIKALETPVYFDRAVDPQAVLMVFRSVTGKILGTVTRFAAHPDIAVLFESHKVTDQYHYNPDWPGYLRDIIDSDIGGTGLYLNGPCANLSVKKGYDGMNTYAACEHEAYRMGCKIGLAFIEQWHAASKTWQDIRINAAASTRVSLPVKKSVNSKMLDPIYRNRQIQLAKTSLESAIADNKSPTEIKRLIDEKKHTMVVGAIINEWVGLTEDELEKGYASIELEAVSLNNMIIAGLPGECLTETCQWLKAQSLGNNLIVLDQVNGYTSYMTTPESYDQGGYSYWGGWLERNAERIMRNASLEIVNSLIDKNR